MRKLSTRYHREYVYLMHDEKAFTNHNYATRTCYTSDICSSYSASDTLPLLKPCRCITSVCWMSSFRNCAMRSSFCLASNLRRAISTLRWFASRRQCTIFSSLAADCCTWAWACSCCWRSSCSSCLMSVCRSFSSICSSAIVSMFFSVVWRSVVYLSFIFSSSLSTLTSFIDGG